MLPDIGSVQTVRAIAPQPDRRVRMSRRGYEVAQPRQGSSSSPPRGKRTRVVRKHEAHDSAQGSSSGLRPLGQVSGGSRCHRLVVCLVHCLTRTGERTPPCRPACAGWRAAAADVGRPGRCPTESLRGAGLMHGAVLGTSPARAPRGSADTGIARRHPQVLG